MSTRKTPNNKLDNSDFDGSSSLLLFFIAENNEMPPQTRNTLTYLYHGYFRLYSNIPINITGTGFDDFVNIIIGKVMYFKDWYPTGEAIAHVKAAFQNTITDILGPLDCMSSMNAAVRKPAEAMMKFRANGKSHSFSASPV
jgi:hypothetical protein